MKPAPILPGAALGVLGSGQLGRMFAMAARRLGYRVHVFSPDTNTPAGQVADVEIAAPYDDLDAVRAFARSVDVVTFEFENVPAATAEAVVEIVPVRPNGAVLHVAQQRAREKGFLAEKGFPVTPFVRVTAEDELDAALARTGVPAVMKTASLGYDGKGQAKVADAAAAREAWRRMGGVEVVVERFIPFEREVSVVAARGLDGWTTSYGVIENTHANHILDVSVWPADVPPHVERRASEIALGVLEALDVVGVLCVEFFLTADGGLLINELAPRPHNSGHLTIDAAVTSQFEQQVRAICGLPPGSVDRLRPAAMANLLGDLWVGGEPDWAAACAIPNVKLHLYGKADARPGRKMGHLTALAETPQQARELALKARAALRSDRV
ncbi:MAG TPA: 5-(carboxyamino)imidazole ribonucleotide synthase [Vicinamibacterales bacterium]